MEQHDEKLKLGSYICLNLFGMCRKLAKGFEKGGMPFVIQVLFIIIFFVILRFKPQIVLNFKVLPCKHFSN